MRVAARVGEREREGEKGLKDSFRFHNHEMALKQMRFQRTRKIVIVTQKCRATKARAMVGAV